MGLWFNRALILLATAMVAAAAARGSSYLMSLEVERIAVTGDQVNIDPEDIQSLVAPKLVDGFLAADLEALAFDLEAMPWVYRASVRRRWPDAVVIHIKEQQPIARWGDRGFLNHEGDLFVVEPGAGYLQLPQLHGEAGSERALMRRYRSLEALLTHLDIGVHRLSVDEVGQYTVALDNGVEVLLGSDDFVARARRFISLYERELAQLPVAYVDLRYSDGAAVQLNDQVAMTEQQMQEGP
ncbi:cell division protein FtsQ [Luminiphilus syltensis NOR5-1B]|uniref:Cell division protein FtsQ n=1 Tax=Luminiphilus syltensis NOR5-1B TaxID=565045 RepID=B8KR48_9GAMM|nr:cell division protein FtsQ [Luminiphilus syltensis NOR5-1B]